MMTVLPDSEWRHRPGLDGLLSAMGADRDEIRYVGGAVRDGLLGRDVADIDLATVHMPDETIRRLGEARIKAVPTGLAHGTVTAVIDHRPVEITTLRSDVATDGRRATVAFTRDWKADAARRDFTINALYARTDNGTISDFFGGLDDLANRHVRFIGDPLARIAEDHLRILRYFRFLARFGQGVCDEQAYAACKAQANTLMALSRERIADELTKLLALSDPLSAMLLMVEGGILRPVLPEIDRTGVERLRIYIAREREIGLAPTALLRLAALLPPNSGVAEQVTARLKLSNKARKRISAALAPLPPSRTPQELAFRVGREQAIDAILLDAGRDVADVRALLAWNMPSMPVGGGDLIALGMSPGPDIAKMLDQVRELWISEGFPSAERALQLARQIVSKFQRASQ